MLFHNFMNLKQCDMSEVILLRPAGEVWVVEECRVSFSPVVFDDLAQESILQTSSQ